MRQSFNYPVKKAVFSCCTSITFGLRIHALSFVTVNTWQKAFNHYAPGLSTLLTILRKKMKYRREISFNSNKSFFAMPSAQLRNSLRCWYGNLQCPVLATIRANNEAKLVLVVLFPNTVSLFSNRKFLEMLKSAKNGFSFGIPQSHRGNIKGQTTLLY